MGARPPLRPPARLPGHGRGGPDPVPVLLDPLRPRCAPCAGRDGARRAAWSRARRPPRPEVQSSSSAHLGTDHGHRPPPILIAGGGIGGLALALALARIGRSVGRARAARRPSRRWARASSSGPTACASCSASASQMRCARSWASPRPCACMTARRHAFSPSCRWASGSRPGMGHPTGWRTAATSHAALLAAASADPRIELRTGFACRLPRRDQGRACEATSAAGETMAGAALIGADGLWSQRAAGHVPGGVAAVRRRHGDAHRIPALPRRARLPTSVVGLWLTPGVHVVHYPVRAGAEIAVVVIAAEDWQRARLGRGGGQGALACSARRISRRALPTRSHRVPAWRKWALHRLPPLPAWSRGRVTLLGDAAHPMLPYLAQGGVLALEDAVVLADCLAAHPGDEASALHAFETGRRVRTEQRAGDQPAPGPHLSPVAAALLGARRRPAPRPRALADGRLRLALRLADGPSAVTLSVERWKKTCDACCNSAVRPAHSGISHGFARP